MSTYDYYNREKLASQSSPPDTQVVTFAAVQTVNFDNGRYALLTLTGNLTSLALSGGKAGGLYCLSLAQDATGSRTLSSPGSNIIFGGTTLYGTTHSAPTLTTTASKVDTYWFYYDGTNYREVFRQASTAS